MGPLGRRAPWRLARSGVWGVLVAGAFMLLATAAGSLPLFAEAAGNAALAARLANVPPDAAGEDAAVVRMTGGTGATAQNGLANRLASIPGLGPAEFTAMSIGVELRGRDSLFTPFITGTGTGTEPGRERARLFGDDDAARVLVPAAGSGSADALSAGRPGIWVPGPLARNLGVGPGDPVQVGVSVRILGDVQITTAASVVAGVYAVAGDGRTPADRPGSRRWSVRRPEISSDSEYGTLPSYLLITGIATARQLAQATGDQLLYAAETRLQPALPTLSAAQRTAAGIRDQQVAVRDPDVFGGLSGVLRERVISGIPEIVSDATTVAGRSVAWTRMAGWAAVALGLLAVLSVAVFGLSRRRLELRLAGALGIRPAVTGAQAGIEVLVPGVLATAAGVAIAWMVVGAIGPPGAITAAGAQAAAVRAGLAGAAGVAVVAVAAWLAARRAARLIAGSVTGSGQPRAAPWELGILVVAVTAAAGLVVRPAQDGEPPSPLDLLVPVLVLAAAGAAGSRLLLGAARQWSGRRPAASWSRPALRLATRRAAAGGARAAVLITMLTTGFGLLLYSLAAATSVRQVTQDRTAVRAGAGATADISSSWPLDPGAGRRPKPVPDEPESTKAVPAARTPPLPDGSTVVWRGRITVPPEYETLDLLVIDPKGFAATAAWGSGPELARARSMMTSFAAADAAAAARLRSGAEDITVPALGVGGVLPQKGQEAAVEVTEGDIPIRMLDVVPAFPGASGSLPVIVVPADSFFLSLGPDDPRLRPPSDTGQFSFGPRQFFPSLWSRTTASQAPLLQRAGGGDVRTYALAAQDPDAVAARNSTAYLVALGVCVAALAVIALALFAERSASRGRAADLMLARMGMGRRGIRRARVGEVAVYTVIAVFLATLAIAALVPLGARLLDPGGGNAPAFVLRIDPRSWAFAALAAAIALMLSAVAGRPRGDSGGEVLRDAE